MSFRLKTRKVTSIIKKILLFCITGDGLFRTKKVVTKLYICMYT